MRDPKRIDRMIEKLRRAWHRTPDQRLGQLVINLAANGGPSYAVEDDEMERAIDLWLEQAEGERR